MRVESLEDRRVLAVFMVDSIADSGAGTLRDAINQANATTGSDEITFDLAVFSTPQTIDIASQLPRVMDSLTITGPGAELLTIDAGDGADGVFGTGDGWRHFVIDNGRTLELIEVEISGVTLAGGDVGYTHLLTQGGAIFSRENLALVNSTISLNSSLNNGGGIHIDIGTATIANCTFSFNSAKYGGAVSSDDGTETVIVDSILATNTASNWGGGVYNGTGTVTINSSLLTANSANVGGGLYSVGTVVLDSTTLSENSANRGGGIYSANGSTTLKQSTLSENGASYEGGGIYAFGGTATVTNSTLSKNSASADGGGLYNFTSEVTIAGSTLSNNSAEGRGGGVYSSATAMIKNSTLAGNSANTGGGIYSQNSPTSINGSIVANSISGGDLSGNFSGSFNLIGDGSNLNLLTSSLPGDPMLGPLADNGGVTLTHSLLPGSIAINRGDPTVEFDPYAFDQRGEGFARVVNGRVDMGAVESDLTPVAIPTSLVVTVTDGGLDGDWSAGDLSLAEAIALANLASGPDQIMFDPVVFATPQTIALTRQLPTISQDLTITGPGANLLTIDAGDGLDGVFATGDGFRHLLIDDGDTETLIHVDISGFTLTGGDLSDESGGAILNRESLTLTDSTLTANAALVGGGLLSSVMATIDSCIFSENAATYGGGISTGGTATINSSTISNNTAKDGGGVRNGGTLTINSGTISYNTATNGGGVYNSGTVTINGSTLSSNSASTGGGIRSYNGTLAAAVHLNNSTLASNVAATFGGGISMSGRDYTGELTIHESALSRNDSGGDGGGIWLDDVTMTITGSTLSGNSAMDDGGAIWIDDGTVAINRSTLSNNLAVYLGGSVYSYRATLTIDTSTLSQNTASSGGGVYSSQGSLAISHSTLSQNTASNAGGGVCASAGTLTISYSTFSANSASNQGGGIYSTVDSTTITGSIVANSLSGGDLSRSKYDIFTGSYNLIEDGSFLDDFTHSISGDPGLFPLADNGGPTYTHALLAGSLAVNAGDPSVMFDPADFDQRGEGFVRVIDGVIDIGSFESDQPPPVQPAWPVVTVTSTEGGLNGNWSVGDISLAEAIVLANQHPGTDRIVFDPILFAEAQTILLDGQVPTITDAVTITGPGAALLTLDAGNGVDGVFATGDGFRHFLIDDGSNDNEIQVEISGLTLTGGDASDDDHSGYGGAILNFEELILASSEISENAASRGGGIYNSYNSALYVGGTATISTSTISANSASDDGGGVYNVNGTLTIHESTISGNTADDDGGGLYSSTFNSGTVEISRSTISTNSGSGIYIRSGMGTITESTITENGGYGVFNSFSTVTINSSIVASSAGRADLGWTTGASFTGNYNLIGDDRFLELFANSISGHPGLGPLADNGGPTQTHAPSAGSLAIDAGNPAVVFDPADFDQRGEGYVRVIGDTVDIGAVESDQPPPDVPEWPVVTVTSLQGGFNGNWLAGDISLHEAIALANQHPGADTILFDPAIFASPRTVRLDSQLPTITDALTITGPGASLLTLDAGNGQDGEYATGDGFRHFYIDDGNNDNEIPVEVSGLTLTGADIVDTYYGGAIFNIENLTLTGAIIVANAAGSYGGGVTNRGTLAINASTLWQNSAIDLGGGVYNYEGTLTINASTFSENNAGNSGGGVYSYKGTTTINTSTFAANSAGNSGGGVYMNRGTATITGSIVASSLSGGDLGGNSGTFSGGYNVIEDDFYLSNFANSFSIDPLLGPLADNDGATLTHALLPGSLAINRGDPTVQFDPADFDQRGEGFARVQNGRIDIGAYESDLEPPVFPTPLVVTVTDDGLNFDWSAGDLSLAEAILAANLTPGPDEITFDPAVFSTPQTIDIASQLPIVSDTLTITGPGAELLTIDAGDGADGVFGTQDGYRHFLIDDGDAENSIEVEISGLTLSGGDVISNDQAGRGGAIYSRETLTLTDAVVQGNAAKDGGGIYSAGTGAIADSVVSHNFANGSGGGIAISGSTALTNSTVTHNAAASSGGGIHAIGTLTVNSSTLSENTAASGGGVFTYIGSTTINSSTLSKNSASRGGGIHTDFGSTTIDGSTLSSNSADVYGGGVYDQSGRTTINSSTIVSNSARSFGGGGVYSGSRWIAIANSIVAGNTSGGDLRGSFIGSYNLLGDEAYLHYFTNSISGDPLLGPLGDNGGLTQTHALLPGSPALDAGDPLFDPDTYVPPLDNDQRGIGYARVVDGGSGLTIDIGAYESQGIPTGFPAGDYNQDGIASLADYVVWRNNLGSTTDLRANGDNTGASENVIDQADYTSWRQNFGNTLVPVTPVPTVATLRDAAFAAYASTETQAVSEESESQSSSAVAASSDEGNLLLLPRDTAGDASPQAKEANRVQVGRRVSKLRSTLDKPLALAFDDWL